MTIGRLSALVFFLGVVGCEEKTQPAPGVVFNGTMTGHAEIWVPLSCGEEVVRDEGIGKLRIGAPVDTIVSSCGVLRDTTLIGAEGMPSRQIDVFFAGDTVQAEVVKDRVWRIAITSPHFRTADSLGVGTPLSRLLQLRNPHGMTGEGNFFVASPEHCGMSFRVANGGPGTQRGDLDQAGLKRLPKSAVVSEILVFGCHLGSGTTVGN